ncbi:hypothetical protein DPMN_171150 [Dreissena polymorpha]|uniref:Uncharacterized protein n=1 Tax=Dreissena polymorpha TaxID=45954 RepID=A0A9D4DXK3_DREPO|nr:hypothetical protein DPMN_171150 [Dreissena polymorpha]
MVTCSSTCLRSLFSSLLTSHHYVECLLNCYITSCVEGSEIFTIALIKTSLYNGFNIEYILRDIPGLWEALCGLNIKSLSLGDKQEYSRFDLNNNEMLSQFLSSLTHLENLSIYVDLDIPFLCKVIIQAVDTGNDLGLDWSNPFQNVTANKEFLSQSLSSLTQLKTLSISVHKDSPGLLEALRGLNIKCLSLEYTREGMTVGHGEYLSQPLSSLTQLKSLSIVVNKDSPILWEAFRGLNIKRLSLSGRGRRGLIVNYVDSLSQSLSSLTQLETLSISISEGDPVCGGPSVVSISKD